MIKALSSERVIKDDSLLVFCDMVGWPRAFMHMFDVAVCSKMHKTRLAVNCFVCSIWQMVIKL